LAFLLDYKIFDIGLLLPPLLFRLYWSGSGIWTEWSKGKHV